mmetsp:Transcript_29366/g.67449  ORF Transcript_29366/g.67449 Transcript_29366/m.67449 type:complete len:276 (-) Transcript_29366:40-867(-)
MKGVPPISVVSEDENDDGDDFQNEKRHQHKKEEKSKRSLAYVKMGFPTREATEVNVDETKGVEWINVTVPTLVHSSGDRKCKAKVLELPIDCPVCGLKLVLAPHLARSFHHLFPVSAFTEIIPQSEKDKDNLDEDDTLDILSSSSIPIKKKRKGSSAVSIIVSSHDPLNSASGSCCVACLRPFIFQKEVVKYERERTLKASHKGRAKRDKSLSSSTSGTKRIVDVVIERLPKFKCPECHNFYCSECDTYLHDDLHNCPGCLQRAHQKNVSLISMK